jgi:hypothetical protein
MIMHPTTKMLLKTLAANVATFAVLSAMTGCPTGTTASSPALPDASVCANLARLGCPEGANAAMCAHVLELGLTTENRLTSAEARCAGTATSKAAVRDCSDGGFFACP